MDIIVEIAGRLIMMILDFVFSILSIFGVKIAIPGTSFVLLHLLNYRPLLVVAFIILALGLYGPAIYRRLNKNKNKPR
ncbi:hypothetical protein [Morganella psychrotolerans]|uniref:hypothetical protein n=1 Tax=Morganella psychrotolerans TaxID=368603 RepID=UPI0039B02ACC